jgi:hypothetical protein
MRALDSGDDYNLLFIGPPASAKTLFLLGILELKHGVFSMVCIVWFGFCISRGKFKMKNQGTAYWVLSLWLLLLLVPPPPAIYPVRLLQLK